MRVPFVMWGYYLLLALVTPRLVALGAVGMALPLGLMVIGVQNAGVNLGFASLGLVIVAYGAAWWWRPRLEVRIEAPVRVAQGQSFALRYLATNIGRRTAYDLAFESLPYPNLTELRFRGAHLACLPPGHVMRLDGGGTALRRGRYRLQPFRWDTDFPLSLWRCGRTDWSERFLNVYPAFAPLTALDIPMGARHRLDTHAARRLTRSALEFHGCREFRAGDAVRHLHPRSSARLGVPVVKEFQAEGQGRTAIVVDTMSALPASVARFITDAVVEAALALTAAVVDYLSREDRVLELLVAGPGLYRFESAGRIGYFEEVLDILAAIDHVTDDPLEMLEPMLLDEIQAIQSVCLILCRWDRRRAELVAELQARQVGLRIVLVTRRGGPPPPDAPSDTVCLDARAIRRGEVGQIV